MHGARARVDEMLDAHFKLEEIETYIESCADLPEDAKSALWLFAWTKSDRQQRRQAVGDLLVSNAHALGK